MTYGLRTLCLLLLLLTFNSLSAQDAVLRGRVFDIRSGEGIAFSTIATSDGKNGVLSDENGYFRISLPSGAQAIRVRMIGYSSIDTLLQMDPGREMKINFALTEQNYNWDPVVITASRSAQRLEQTVSSMDIMPARMVENRIENTMETAVEQVPGVTVIDGQANIRGGSGFSYGAGTRVLVLVDDLPMMAGDVNDVKWNFLPIEQLDQVEVLKGASSALFGSSALNGVINMRTVMPGEKPVTTASVYGGVYDSPKDREKKWWGDQTRGSSGFNVSHRQKVDNLSIVAGAHYFKDDGYRQGEYEKRFRLNTHLRYTFPQIKGLTAGVAVNTQKTMGGNFLIWANDTSGAYLPLQSADASTVSNYVSYRTTVDPYIIYSPGRWMHKLRMRYFMADNFNDTEQGSLSDFYYLDYISQATYGKFTFSGGTTGTMTKTSGELFDSRIGTSLAFYTQTDVNLGKLQLSGGFRMESANTGASSDRPGPFKLTGESLEENFDYAAKRFKPLKLFRAGANYQLFEGTFVRTSYGQGFRFPSIGERSIRTRVGDIVIYPNEDLQNETGWSAEIGVKQLLRISSWKGYIDMSYFHQAYKNMMEFTFGQWGNFAVDPIFGFGFKSTNIGNAYIKGIELDLAGEGKIGKVTQTILAGYTYIDPRQLDFDPAVDTAKNTSDENILKYRFRHLVKFDSETGYGKLSLGLSGRFYSNIENIDEPFESLIPGVKDYRAQQPWGTWIFDARLSWQISQKVRLTAMAKNVLNEEFMTRPADLQAPRSFQLSLGVKM